MTLPEVGIAISTLAVSTVNFGMAKEAMASTKSMKPWSRVHRWRETTGAPVRLRDQMIATRCPFMPLTLVGVSPGGDVGEKNTWTGD